MTSLSRLSPERAQVAPYEERLRFRAVDRARHAIDRAMDLGTAEMGKLFTRFDAAKIMAAAEAVDARSRRSGAGLPLAGLPISIKDLFDEQGEVTGAASVYLLGGPPATSTATAVSRLTDAGAIPFGRTTMSEFAYSGIGLNPHYGTPGNIRDRDRIPGGSTSGGALTVALGLADAALGSDTGGSVRIPAALNGLAGFKPSQAKVPLAGAFPLSGSYDSVGPIAGTIGLCAEIHAALAAEARPAERRNLRAGPRVGVVRTVLTDGLDDRVSSDFDRALRALKDAGARLEDVSLHMLQDAGSVNRILVATEAHEIHADHLTELEEIGDPRVLRRIRFAETVSPEERAEALRIRRDACAAFDRIARGFDVLIGPTLPVVAPRIAEAEADFDRLNALMLRNPSTINFVDGCAATVPMSARDGLPTGLMLIGPNGADWQVLDIAEQVEARLARD